MNLTTTRICMSLRHNLYPITSKLNPQKVADQIQMHLPIPQHQTNDCLKDGLELGTQKFYVRTVGGPPTHRYTVFYITTLYHIGIISKDSLRTISTTKLVMARQLNNLLKRSFFGPHASLYLRKVKKTIFGFPHSQLCVGVKATVNIFLRHTVCHIVVSFILPISRGSHRKSFRGNF